MREKTPLRPYRWERAPLGEGLSITVAQSAWRRGGTLVISSVEDLGSGYEFRLSISHCQALPSDERVKAALAEFGASDAVELPLSHQELASNLLGVQRRARQFCLKAQTN